MDVGTMTLAAFLQLASTCGQGIAPQTLADVVHTESGFNSLAINVNGPGGGSVQGITSKAEAISKARALIRAGRNIDAGVAQINSRNWDWLGLTVETVFEPCLNVQAQAFMLQSFSRYNTGHPTRGLGYAVKVATGRANAAEGVGAARPTRAPQGAAAPPTPPLSPRDTCPGAPPKWDVWGTARHVARCNARIVTATATTIEDTTR